MRDEAIAAFSAAGDLDELKAARLAHTGDRAPLTLANAEIGALPPQARAEAGKRVGAARGAVRQALADRTTELEAMIAYITGQKDRKAALEDVEWAVLNTKEFLFNH